MGKRLLYDILATLSVHLRLWLCKGRSEFTKLELSFATECKMSMNEACLSSLLPCTHAYVNWHRERTKSSSCILFNEKVFWLTCKVTNQSFSFSGSRPCFYQLFEVSFWRHPFTAEYPLVQNAKFPKSWWRNKLTYILDDLRVHTFSANCHFWVNGSFD